jgi:histidinol-phosphate phosphatase family protein
MLRKAVFLDRDGVLNVCPGRDRFVLSWDAFHFMPGVREQLKRLRGAGFFLSLATSQSGIGRGLMTLETLHDIHARMQAALGSEALDAIYFCPHHPDAGCTCRKPSPEMILSACAQHGLDPRRSFLIGDQPRDIAMGHAAGCRTILCRDTPLDPATLQGEQRPERAVSHLSEAVDWILSCEFDGQ